MDDKLKRLKDAFTATPGRKSPASKTVPKRQTQPSDKDVFAGLVANLKKKQMEQAE